MQIGHYNMTKKISKTELSRKVLHLTSIWIPILCWLTDDLITFLVLLGVSVFAIPIDILRIANTPLRPHVHKLLKDLKFSEMFRSHESERLSGATYMLISAIISILIMPQPVFIIAFTIVIISDTLAALIGIKYGTRVFMGKTIEGSAAFLISAIVISIAFGALYNLDLIALIACCLCATIAEFYSSKIRINDNLLVPLVYGIIWEILK